MNELDSQKELIESEDWDVLFVLDACRYDFFEAIHADFLDGNLRKVKSEGSYTERWFKNTFTTPMDNTVYVNSNPLIPYKIPSWQDYFYCGLDVSGDTWSDEYMTPIPEKVGRKARQARAKYPGRKMIVHFMQPHRPYLELKDLEEFDQYGLKRFRERMNSGSEGVITRVRKLAGNLLSELIGGRRTYLLRRYLGLGGPGHLERIAKKKGSSYLFTLYAKNLKTVLEEVQRTIERMPDKHIVITGDHGELLGEDGIYEHPTWSSHRILVEIPWLEIEAKQ